MIDNEEFPFTPWFEAKYRKKTAWFHSPLQHNIYRSLLAEYGVEGPLKPIESYLRGICTMADEKWEADWKTFWPDIMAMYFTLDADGLLHNKEADRIRAEQRNPKARQAKSRAGRAGAAARYGKKQETKAPAHSGDVNAAVDLYNAAAKQHGWPECMRMDDTRKGKLAKRLQDAGGIEGWKSALEKAVASDFLMGRTRRGEEHKNWKFGMKFLLQASSFINLMEGQYDNRTPTGNGPVGSGKGRQAPTEQERRAAIIEGARAGFVESGRTTPDVT